MPPLKLSEKEEKNVCHDTQHNYIQQDYKCKLSYA